MRHWKRSPEVWDKGGDLGPVTEADLAVDAMLSSTLREARPDHGWLSEETPDDTARLRADRVFIVDPIDGTRAFIAGEDTFSHSLAIADRGRITAAVVYLPARDLLFSATSDGPATCNGRTVRPSDRADPMGSRILASRASLAPGLWPGGVPDVARAFRPSIAYRLCLAAEGAFDGMLMLSPAWEWDIAAGALIAERAGAVVTDGGGAALRFNRPDPRAAGIVAAPPALHAALMARRAPG